LTDHHHHQCYFLHQVSSLQKYTLVFYWRTSRNLQ